MKLSECSHIRVRDDNEYGTNVEEFIKSIEKQFKIDFRSLPQWKDIIQRMHVMTTDYKRRIQQANHRKYTMMKKIFIEATRESPFELTDKLARSKNKWQVRGSAREKSTRVSLVSVTLSTHVTEEIASASVISENTSTGHQNTEIALVPIPPSKSDLQETDRATEPSVSHLPVKICANPHKLISPLSSRDIVFEYKNVPSTLHSEVEKDFKEWLFLNQAKSIRCVPQEIIITNYSLNQQTIKIKITNCSTKYMNLRFMYVTEDCFFKRAKVIPEMPKKLFPGISVNYNFVFKLAQNLEDFTSLLYFRVGQKVTEEVPIEAFCIPIKSKFTTLCRSVLVTKEVYTPPSYLWHLKSVSGFPSGTLKISSQDIYSYHVHIIKKMVNIGQEYQESVVSIEVISPDTESLIDRLEDNEIVNQSKALLAKSESQPIKSIDVIALLVEDLVDLALDTFVFENTYIFLEPYSKKSVNVYFTKAERVGSHHYYYDVEFFDIDYENLIMTKTVKVFAEILPHPIQVYPNILDMSVSPITHGYYEDDITINNTHKLYPVTIKFKLTSKMKKLFCITPMETLVPAQSSVNFKVRLCSKESSKECDELAHFTIKIKVVGHKSIYEGVKPFFYEIIAPCASEFKKIYNDKYFKDVDMTDQL